MKVHAHARRHVDGKVQIGFTLAIENGSDMTLIEAFRAQGGQCEVVLDPFGGELKFDTAQEVPR